MLSLIFLSIFSAGLDHNVLYWVLLPLSILMIYFAVSGQVKINIKPGSTGFFLGLFWAWALVSIFWSINPHRTLVEFLQLSIYVIVFVVAANLKNEDTLKVGGAALATGFGVAVYGIMQYLFGGASRIESTIANANALGIFLAVIFLLGWGYYLRKPHRYVASAAVVLLVALILSMSRGSFISLAVSMPLLFIGLQKDELFAAIKKTVIIIVCALALGQLLFYVAPNLQSQVLSDILTERAGFISWSGISRFGFWQTGLHIFANNAILGTGLGTYASASGAYYLGDIWFARFAHNHYIQTMAELGLVGAGLLLAFLVQVVRSAWQKFKSNQYPIFYPGLLAASLAFLIHIGADVSWNYPAVAALFFAIAGTITAEPPSLKEKVPRAQLYKLVQIVAWIIIFSLTMWQYSAFYLYERAMKLEEKFQLDEVVATYDLANRIYPINSMAYSTAGNAYFMMFSASQDIRYMDEAITRMEKAVSLNPANAILQNQLGRYYWVVGRWDDAEVHLKLATDYAEYSIGLLLDLAWVYMQMERFDEARQVVDRGLAIEDDAYGMHPTEEKIELIKQQIETLHEFNEMLQ